jgi:hypothetical protein
MRVTDPGEHANGVVTSRVFRVILLPRDRAILASAYELAQTDVEQDAAHVRDWGGTEPDLMATLQARHGWTAASEYAPFYVAALRQALDAATA